jgi:hypothetical protein
MGEIVGKGNGEKLNKYALSCTIVISMISIIFGYGEFSLAAD